jgi:Mg2+ and Co2+ transporter CorA
VVDFSEDEMVMHDFDNAGLIQFIDKKQEDWIKCRWINVNGLSWDVIQALGKYKRLHRLAIEDMVNTNNRTKADWYVYLVQDTSPQCSPANEVRWKFKITFSD